MSVLIKGMKMPKACCECGFNHCSQSRDDDTCLLLDKGISQLFVLVDRLPDCPLVEVPFPHGRLIDGDNVIKLLREQLTGDRDTVYEYYDDGLEMAISELSIIPTIIEAEEGEEA